MTGAMTLTTPSSMIGAAYAELTTELTDLAVAIRTRGIAQVRHVGGRSDDVLLDTSTTTPDGHRSMPVRMAISLAEQVAFGMVLVLAFYVACLLLPPARPSLAPAAPGITRSHSEMPLP